MTPTTIVHKLPDHKGAATARFLISLAQADGAPGRAAEVAAEQCQSTPHVAKALELRQKGAVAAGTTAGSHYIDDMVPYGIGQETFQLLQSASIFGRLTPAFRRVEF